QTSSGGAASPSSPVAPVAGAPATTLSAYFVEPATQAPPIALIDPDARPFTLVSLRGHPVLVFFGYTHCPDVCPTTIGTLRDAMRAVGPEVRALFVSIDPERDTTAWLKEYATYLPAGFVALTGSSGQVRAAADAWGVRYARVDGGDGGPYTMSHTADVFLVDSGGTLRARFPFGTEAAPIAAVIRSLAAGTPGPATAIGSASPAPSDSAPAPASAAVYALRPEVLSSSVWAGGDSPVMLALYGPAGRLFDTALSPTVQVLTREGALVGPAVQAVAVRPPGVTDVSYVARLDFPSPGWFRVAVSASPGSVTLAGGVDVAVLDPGTTPQLGAPAPTAHTPTIGDAGGDARAVTTDPAPDLRLSSQSTTDALAARQPFVLVIDSTRFRVTSACGKAIVMARYLLDRWPQVAFVHLEPYRYSIVTDTPVLDGTLADPPLTPATAAWGIGGPPWGALSMPWIFVVDGDGLVRAKYQGVIGSDDVDVILSLIEAGG
ncbi:MAG TPA: SCO family protein, partial [Candidatus Limnocylindrales bacterium]